MTNERLTVRELVARRGSSGVYSIAPSDSVEEAAREMRAQGVSGISVLEAGKLVGFLSEKDISHLVARGEDPAETANLAETDPDRFERLKIRMINLHSEIRGEGPEYKLGKTKKK